MALIDATYFIRDLNIADAKQGVSSRLGNTLLTDYIPVYEKEYLMKVLGYPLYTAFIAGLAITPTVPQKWLDLKNGVTYTVNGKDYQWVGFTNADKVTPIANYVYIQYMRNTSTNTTGTGEAQNAQQNAVTLSPDNKIHHASVEMTELTHSLYHYLDNNKIIYTEYNYSRVQCLGSYNAFNL